MTTSHVFADLIDVVEYFVVERDEVLQLSLRHAALGRRHVSQGVRHQEPAVLRLHLLEQQEDRVHHRVRQIRVLRRVSKFLLTYWFTIKFIFTEITLLLYRDRLNSFS